MKKLIKDKGIFDCTFRTSNNYKLLNSKNEEIDEWKLNKVVYLKSDSIIIASVDMYGKLHLYHGWDKNRSNLYRICKFTGISTKQIKNMIAIKHCDIVIENKMKIIR